MVARRLTVAVRREAVGYHGFAVGVGGDLDKFVDHPGREWRPLGDPVRDGPIFGLCGAGPADQ